MSSDNEVEVVVTWYVPLKQSPIYVLSAKEIFSGKAHEAPPIDKKRMMLLDIVNRPSEEYFLRGSQQAKDFELLKKQCFSGWTTVSARVRIWTVPYTSEKLALLLDMFFSGPETTLTKRNCAGRVRTQLERSYPAFTSILEEYEEEKNSQEIFEFCLAQTRLE